MVVAGPLTVLAESALSAKAFPLVPERAGRVACFAAAEFFCARTSNPKPVGSTPGLSGGSYIFASAMMWISPASGPAWPGAS